MIEDADGLLRFSTLTRDRPVPHAFASAVAFDAFDARTERDRRRLADVVYPGATLVTTRQRHGARVESVTGPESAVPDGVDGLITDRPGVLLLAFSADCPLLLLCDDDRRAVAALHCGWRGVAAGIVEAGVEAMSQLSAAPTGLRACVSPAAGACCYEVGDEVIEAVCSRGVDADAIVKPLAGRARSAVDLKVAITRLLTGCGVAEDRVEVAPHCSICGGDRFHSYRRHGPGVPHMAAVIGLGSATAGPR